MLSGSARRQDLTMPDDHAHSVPTDLGSAFQRRSG